MFGLFYAIFIIAVLVIGGTKRLFHDVGERCESIREDKLTYYDSSGRERLVSNHHVCGIETDMVTKDVLLRDLTTWEAINLSKKKRYEELNEAIKSGYPSAIPWQMSGSKLYRNHPIEGFRYLDVKTKKLMVQVYFDRVYLYVDAETGEALRFTDKEKSFNNGEDEKAIIEKYEKLRNNQRKCVGWTYKFIMSR